MNKIASAVIGALLMSAFLLAPAPALTDCAADATALEASLAARPSHPKATKVTNMIAKARAGLAEGKKKKCDKLVVKARGIFSKYQKKKAGGGGGGAAACAAKVEALQKRVDTLPGGHARYGGLTALLENARGKAADGKKKNCEKLANQAETNLGKAGY